MKSEEGAVPVEEEGRREENEGGQSIGVDR